MEALIYEECADAGDSCSSMLYFCSRCEVSFCSRCWDEQPAHKKHRTRHEKTESSVAQTVHSVLSPSSGGVVQEELFAADAQTAWFGIDRDQEGPLIFHDYGKYAELLDVTNSERFEQQGQRSHASDLRTPCDKRTPSLISFVGQTGAGKSTIIRLLIQFYSTAGRQAAAPVIGAAGADVPSSEDVHLYLDPSSALSDCPLLYADCEGLDGGEREPLGAKFKRIRRLARLAEGGNARQPPYPTRYSSDRELTWANSNETRSRAFAVTHLYPRLLYTFSDVIVFVLRNPRVVEGVFQKLIEWAAAALEKSSNQPILPHAIIILNATPHDIDELEWDVDAATDNLLKSLKDTASRNPVLQKYAQFWKERDRRIETLEDLLLAYYSSLQIVRVPTDERPTLLKDQIVRLYSCIQWASSSARQRKAVLRMLLDAEELQSYLHYAFDHYAKTLDLPFDFVEASFSNSPIPLDFSGNILKLAILLRDQSDKACDAHAIFKHLSLMVASSIMLDTVRHKLLGTANHIFPGYIDYLDAAFLNFCDMHWPCEFIADDGSKCVNVRRGHSSKGHQLKNGTVFAAGEYCSRFSFESDIDEFHSAVFFDLEAVLCELQERVQNGEAQEFAAAEIHKDIVMARFYSAAASKFHSNTVCLCCILNPPDSSLPCGHIFCTPCVITYGHQRSKTVFELEECPLCKSNSGRHFPFRVYVKPKTAGVRLLSLDGGGIRGIVQIEVLRMIEDIFQGRIPVQCFFDLIIAEGTSGTIALGLATCNWSIEECANTFERICSQAFTPRRGSNIPGIGWLVENYKSKYRTRPLERSLIDAFSSSQALFGGPCSRQPQSYNVKVAVLAISNTNQRVVLGNYNRQSSESLPYNIYRSERPESELRVWEAARATSATTTLFKPFHHKGSSQTFTNYAGHIDLITVTGLEWKAIWQDVEQDYPDILLSLGTGYDHSSQLHTATEAPRKKVVLVKATAGGKRKSTASNDSPPATHQRAWDMYTCQLPDFAFPRFFRVDPEFTEDLLAVDNFSSFKSLQQKVRGNPTIKSQIRRLASLLVASLFYFELSEPISESPENGFVAKGTILCRLPPTSPEIRELGKFIKSHGSDGAYFSIQQVSHGSSKRIDFNTGVTDMMIRDEQFVLESQTIPLLTKDAVTEILLNLNFRDMDYRIEGEHHISGFPRSLFDDESLTPRPRRTSALHSNRWAAAPNGRARRWAPPDPRMVPNTKNFIRPDAAGLSSNIPQQQSSRDIPLELSATRELAELDTESATQSRQRNRLRGRLHAEEHMQSSRTPPADGPATTQPAPSNSSAEPKVAERIARSSRRYESQPQSNRDASSPIHPHQTPTNQTVTTDSSHSRSLANQGSTSRPVGDSKKGKLPKTEQSTRIDRPGSNNNGQEGLHTTSAVPSGLDEQGISLSLDDEKLSAASLILSKHSAVQSESTEDDWDKSYGKGYSLRQRPAASSQDVFTDKPGKDDVSRDQHTSRKKELRVTRPADPRKSHEQRNPSGSHSGVNARSSLATSHITTSQPAPQLSRERKLWADEFGNSNTLEIQERLSLDERKIRIYRVVLRDLHSQEVFSDPEVKIALEKSLKWRHGLIPIFQPLIELPDNLTRPARTEQAKFPESVYSWEWVMRAIGESSKAIEDKLISSLTKISQLFDEDLTGGILRTFQGGRNWQPHDLFTSNAQLREAVEIYRAILKELCEKGTITRDTLQRFLSSKVKLSPSYSSILDVFLSSTLVPSEDELNDKWKCNIYGDALEHLIRNRGGAAEVARQILKRRAEQCPSQAISTILQIFEKIDPHPEKAS